jgi:hypothetical protein
MGDRGHRRHRSRRLSRGGRLSIGEAIGKRKRRWKRSSTVIAYVARQASRSATRSRDLRLCESVWRQATVFSYFGEEEALTWDYPEQKRALEGIGVKSFG